MEGTRGRGDKQNNEIKEDDIESRVETPILTRVLRTDALDTSRAKTFVVV